MTYTTLISTEDLARNLNNPDFVIFDVRFTLDDESWGKRVYEEVWSVACNILKRTSIYHDRRNRWWE